MHTQRGDTLSDMTFNTQTRWLESELNAALDEFNLVASTIPMLPLDAKDPLTIRAAILFKEILAIQQKRDGFSTQNTLHELNHDHELKLVEQQLKDFHHIAYEDIDNFNREEYLDESTPWLRFLLEKRDFLIQLKKQYEVNLPPTVSEAPHAVEKKSRLQFVFDIGKKIVDLVDDAWAAMRSVFPKKLIEAVSPILIGATGFLIHLGEGYQGAKLAYEAYKNEKIGQRKTRILTSVLTFMAAGAGVGMSIALLASAAGAAVGSVALLPVLIPGALTAIYGLSLWRQSYIFHRAKEEEGKAWDNYKAALESSKPKANELNEAIQNITNQKNILANENKDLTRKFNANYPLDVTEKEIYSNYSKEMEALSKTQTQLNNEYATLQGNLSFKKHLYNEAQEKRFEAEANVAFNTIEVLASTMVLVGLALATAAIVGASIASFGALPLAILVSGVVLGTGSKVFEMIDEKANHAYTHGIRNWFVTKFDSIFHKSRDNKLDVVAEFKTTPAADVVATKDTPSLLQVDSQTPVPAVLSSSVRVTARSDMRRKSQTDGSVSAYSGHFLNTPGKGVTGDAPRNEPLKSPSSISKKR